MAHRRSRVPQRAANNRTHAAHPAKSQATAQDPNNRAPLLQRLTTQDGIGRPVAGAPDQIISVMRGGMRAQGHKLSQTIKQKDQTKHAKGAAPLPF